MGVYTNDVVIDISGNTVQVSNLPAIQPVSGSVSVSNFPVTQPVSGTVAVTQSTSPWITSAPISSTATVAQVVLTNNTNGTLLAANASRKSAIIFVPMNTLQIKYGATASVTSFTYKVTASNTTITISGYTGQIDAFGTGQTVTVTELV